MKLPLLLVLLAPMVAMAASDEAPAVKVFPTPEQTPHEKYRRAIVGPGLNEPEAYPGYAGFVGWQGIAKTKSGALLVTFTSGYWHATPPTPMRDSEKGLLKEHGIAEVDAPRGGRAHIMRSDDGGLTWSKPGVLIDTPQDDRSPAAMQLSDGTLVCSFFTWPTTTKVGIIRSTDDGRTWEQEPRYLDAPLNWTATDGPPIELPDKSVLVAAYGAETPDDKKSQTAIFKSTDRGATWKHLATVDAPFDQTEPDIEALPDGRLITISRREGAVAWSSDQGKTWTKPAPLPFKMFDPWLLALKNGTLVCLHGSYTPGKPGLRAILSPDGGKTWHAAGTDFGFAVDPTCYGYSRGVELDDGSVLVVYQFNGGHVPAHMKSQQIFLMRFKVNADQSGIELLPAPGMSVPARK